MTHSSYRSSLPFSKEVSGRLFVIVSAAYSVPFSTSLNTHCCVRCSQFVLIVRFDQSVFDDLFHIWKGVLTVLSML